MLEEVISDSKLNILDIKTNINVIDKSFNYLYIENLKYKDLKGKEGLRIFVDFNRIPKRKYPKVLKRFWRIKIKYMLNDQSSHIIFTNNLLSYANINFNILSQDSSNPEQEQFIEILKSMCFEYKEETYQYLLYKIFDDLYDKKLRLRSKREIRRFVKNNLELKTVFNHRQQKVIIKYIYKFFDTGFKVPISKLLEQIGYTI